MIPTPTCELSSVKIRQQRFHLRGGKAPRERRHHALALKHRTRQLHISSRGAAGQLGAVEHSVQIWRNCLERQVVVFMAMRAAHLVKMLSLRLLRREFPFAVAT